MRNLTKINISAEVVDGREKSTRFTFDNTATNISMNEAQIHQFDGLSAPTKVSLNFQQNIMEIFTEIACDFGQEYIVNFAS